MEKLKGKLEEEPETSQSHHQSDDSTNLQPPDYISKAQSLKEAGNKLFQRRDYENAMLKYREAIEVLPDSHVEVSHIRSNMAFLLHALRTRRVRESHPRMRFGSNHLSRLHQGPA
ncbi:hypothetical protein Rs2_11738 [Raphanus sativus]|nr:hypothetical protein Rs2_11738 [Raphanus sativus]